MGKVFTLQSQPGIQRDGTSLDANRFSDGQWVRFRRGKPRKMAGYREITANINGPVRAMFVWTRQDMVQLTAFSAVGAEAIQVDHNGIGANIIDRTPAGWVNNADTVWQVDTMYDAAFGSTKSLILAHAAPNLSNIDSGVVGEIYYGDTNGTEALTAIGNSTAVSGGIVVLHPYLVRYGSDGFVSWSNQNEPRTFTQGTGDAGTARVTGSKIVKGMAVKGQGQSPTGLLWSLDAIIRMVYIGGQAVFKFDPVSNASSILSSASVIEYDGVFYWVGIDRFLAYAGGQIQEVPNDTNLDDFFDHLNFAQRQKVFARVVPRHGEIWWHYPRGTATECTHAVIYNVREKCWYDCTLARSAGSSPKVFRFPVLTDSVANKAVVKMSLTSMTGSFLNGQHITCSSGAQGTLRKVLGTTIFVELSDTGEFVNSATVTTSGGGTGTINSVPFATHFHSVWLHEVGLNKVQGDTELAIPSFFETSDFGFPTGGPAQESPMGDNLQARVMRLEPDFNMVGTMTVEVVGGDTAQSPATSRQAYPFDGTTEKIDMREQLRTLYLRFASNDIGGDYTMGRVIMHVEPGDERG
jgi:hypothetical protein